MTSNPFGSNQVTNQNQNQQQFQSGSGNLAQSGVQTGNVVGNQQFGNVYSTGQSNLQNQLLGTIGNFLQTGNLPGTFAAPQQVIDAYNSNFQQSVAPGLAAQYGAGSPQIGSQQTLGLQQLLSNLYQTQSGNFGNVLNAGANQAYNAIGSNANTSQYNQTNSNQNQSQNWQSNNSLLGSLLSTVGVSGFN